MKKYKSIYIDGFESFIHSEYIQRPYPFMQELELFAGKMSLPIVSPATGNLLAFFTQIYQPKKVLELGTGIGYSTIWMISKSHPESQFTTIDRNGEQQALVLKSFEKIEGFDPNRVQFLNSNIVEYVSRTESFHEYDFIFIDCDKICYPDLLELLLNKTNEKVKLVFDNVLWHGRVMNIDPSKQSDIAISHFWEKVKRFPIKYNLFPIGDGVLLVEK